MAAAYMRTYKQIVAKARRTSPEATQIMAGGLLVTFVLIVCSAVLWFMGRPATLRASHITLYGISMKNLALIMLLITCAGSALVDRAAKRGGRD